MNEIKKIRVGITGQSGFIGAHLYNYLGLKENLERIPFADHYFTDCSQLDNFVKQCDCIVHLAAKNRDIDANVVYDTNTSLTNDLISACVRTDSRPHIIFSSSTQEEFDNAYGKSKKDGRIMFERWAEANQARFTAMIIPNVFGPFGRPYYNSVIATFCHQLTHDEKPEIHIDGELKLIYINELVEEFYKEICTNTKTSSMSNFYKVQHTAAINVSSILNLLSKFKTLYSDNFIIPELKDRFELNLFNTFHCYLPKEKYPLPLTQNIDNRGSFVEIIKANTSGQFSYSTTKPGITRGDHFHTRKIERFAVIKGKAVIELRRMGTKEIISYGLDGNAPSFVDIPVWHVHNLTNTGEEELITLFWVNEAYDPDNPDTYFEKV